ncbi:DUF1533 domain-containing protein [Paenibacillus psychroresistens]|uniref:DUF1533 domain-containing protein n=1 Tax=Paenibacillus psychroresistens TaxID=1778678 RepID=A0A6B8RW56_9BACL|nr:cadherin-like beta sandwich domain-containing protein [Paenibacillus psychroresistens]QGQ99358.1 DUF1533 domain-containing protein [Paenibacillus psychroresistens]
MRAIIKKGMSIILVMLVVFGGLNGLFVGGGKVSAAGAPNWEIVGNAGFSASNASSMSTYVYNGTPFVAYVDFGNDGKATVMKYDGSNWVTVGNAGFSAAQASNTSLSVYNGTPYVAYVDGGNGNKATVMKYNGSNWVIVGSAGFSAGDVYKTSLSIYNGTPYVGYTDNGNGSKATVMKYDGSNWVSVGSAGFSAGTAFNMSISIDNGTPYVGYTDGGNGNKATVMKYNGSNWVTVGNAGFSEGFASYPFFSVSNGLPYVAYIANSKITVMKYDGSNWATLGNASFSTGSSDAPSMYVESGTPYLVYSDMANDGKATISKYDGSNWVTVGSAGFTASGASIPSIYVYNGTPYVGFMDGANSYKATVMRFYVPSSNANLSSIGLSSGALNETFAASTTSYTQSVSNSISSLTVTPSSSDTTAIVKVNGTTVASGNASTTIPLSVGANTITVLVTAENNSTKTYTVTVTRAAASANANLSNIALSSGALNETFAAATTSYTQSVANSITSLTVTPTAAAGTAIVKVNGATVASGNASSAIPLSVGANTITVLVTAENNSTKTYTVTVTRATASVVASSNASLSGISVSSGALNETFATATTSYTQSVASSVESLTVTPTVADGKASVKVNGTSVASGSASSAISLSEGANTITVLVTAEDSSTKTYTLTVTRAAIPSVNLGSDLISLDAAKYTIGVGDSHSTIVWSNNKDNSSSVLTASNITFASSSSAIATVDANGIVTGVNKGTVTISAVYTSDNTVYKRYATVTVDAKAPAFLTASSTVTGAVYLSIVGPDGNPVENAAVKISQGTKVWPLAKTDSNGRVLAYVPAGKYNVLVYSTNGLTMKNYAFQNLSVAIGQRSEPLVQPQFNLGAVSLSVDTVNGGVKKITGAASSGSTIIVRDGLTLLGTAKTDKAGKFSIALKKPLSGNAIIVTAIDADESEKSVQIQVPLVAPVVLTAATKLNDVDHDTVITFKDTIGLLIGSVTAVTYDGNVLVKDTHYKLASGKLTIIAGVIKNAGSHTIVVKSSAYDNAQVTQVIKAGVADATQSSYSLNGTLTEGGSATATVILKDKYGNLTESKQVYADITVTNTTRLNAEKYTIGTPTYRATVKGVKAGVVTDPNGSTAISIAIPASVDIGDGVSIQLRTGTSVKGTTFIGDSLSYTK